jgi:hypothetical protein
MKECIECHEPINAEASFCNRCGKKQPAFFTPSQEKSNEKVAVAWGQPVYQDPNNDLRNMLPIEARWRPTFDHVGIQTIGMRDIPLSPTRIWVGDKEWMVSHLGDNVSIEVPSETLARKETLEGVGLVIDYWILMEEQKKHTYVPKPTPITLVLVGVIGTDKNRGIWCIFGRWVH